MFKLGDLVTGKDRSYERSIYKLVAQHNDNTGIYEIVSFKGRTNELIVSELLAKGVSQSDINSVTQHLRNHSEFRLATWLEIKRSSTNSHHVLMAFLWKLDVRLYR
jgi:hypothetical protein